MPEFLPISRADMTRRGWDQCDFVYIIGDGYVDHPSFGHAIISRVLEDAGYKVGILSQPDWKDPASIDALGEPRRDCFIRRHAGAINAKVQQTGEYPLSPQHSCELCREVGFGTLPDYFRMVTGQTTTLSK